MLVNDDDVRFLSCYADVWRDGSSRRGLEAREIRKDFEFVFVNERDDIIDDVIVPPCESPLLKISVAVVENV